MEIVVQPENEGTIRVRCAGELDYGSAERFIEAVTRLDAGRVVIDFASVEFVDSTGVAALCRAIEHVRERQGDVKVVNVHQGVYEILTLVGCVDAFGAENFTTRPGWSTHTPVP